jgi:SAM-dependent methyltransferase
MDFRLKCLVQQVLSALPASHKLNRLVQVHIARSLPVTDAQLEIQQKVADSHLAEYTKRAGKMPQDVLDIGSGSDLSMPIAMGKRGVRVTASDITPLASNALVADMLERNGLASLPDANVNYVVYPPPYLPFPDRSFDLVTSTSVLEHVPAAQLPALFSEIRRVLKPSGIASHHVAHKDHWSDADSKLHSMNYLRYSPSQWRWLNPSVLYQNRLLHSDYCNLLSSSGFSFDAKKTMCEEYSMNTADIFKDHPIEDLCTTHTWFTCFYSYSSPMS